MATTLPTAVDEMLGRLKTQWDADAATAISSMVTPVLVYEASEKDLLPHPSSASLPWARAVIRHETGKQTSMGGVGNRKFRRGGTIWVQVFYPWEKGADLAPAAALAGVAQSAYEGKRTSNVTFTNVTLVEKGKDGNFYRHDVTAKFEWTEIK